MCKIELMISIKHLEHLMFLYSSIFEAQNVVAGSYT